MVDSVLPPVKVLYAGLKKAQGTNELAALPLLYTRIAVGLHYANIFSIAECAPGAGNGWPFLFLIVKKQWVWGNWQQ